MHELNKHFDNIYVLYIDDEERSKISHKLDMYGINVEFFEGVNGYKCQDRYGRYVKSFDKNNPNSKLLNCGSFGHILSFIKILNDAKDKKYKKILILEPDVYFCNNFSVRCKRYLNMDYKILYFGASQNKYYKEQTWDIIDEKQNDNLKSGWYHPYKTLGTFGIAIDESMYEECLQVLRPLEAPTDVSLIKVQDKYHDKCIVAYPNIICCDLTKSKTSSIKNQTKSMQELRWILKYDMIDRHVFRTEIDCWYEIEITLNSYLGHFILNIVDGTDSRITPDITFDDIDCFTRDDKIFICFLSKTNTSTLITNNIFPTKTQIRKISQNYAKMRFPPVTIYKIKNEDLKKYYKDSFNLLDENLIKQYNKSKRINHRFKRMHNYRN